MYNNERALADGTSHHEAVFQSSARRQNFRLNPSEQMVCYSTELQGSAFIGETRVWIGHTIELKGTLRCGVATRIECERKSLRGIAARLSLSETDEIIAELILLNRDSSLDLPLARSNNMEDLAADWQMWAKRYNLPLILIEADGVEQMISARLGSLDVASPTPRRAPAHFRARRPRFLVRRKKGSVLPQNQIAGKELIARN